MTGRLGRLLTAALLLALPASAQEVDRSEPMRVPFGVGERLEYDIRFGKVHVGNGEMEILPFDTVRGRNTWHTVFRLSGGIPFYHVNDRYETWFDTHTLASLRYWQGKYRISHACSIAFPLIASMSRLLRSFPLTRPCQAPNPVDRLS
jgi:hypothetical protein